MKYIAMFLFVGILCAYGIAEVDRHLPQKESFIDFNCVWECVDRGGSYQTCKKMCSY